MEVVIISKEAIKPSKPTPSHCKLFKLSGLDQISPSIYVPILMFYQAPSAPRERANLSSQLKKSLSETLTHYYPFAGKVKDDIYIDCDDEMGALFLEAETKNNLVDILTSPKLEALSSLFPVGLQWKSSKDSSILAVQLSHFDCGGMSIGICMSHKIADACTIFNFLNDWASHTRQSGKNYSSICPLFNAASSIWPPSDQLVMSEAEFTRDNLITRRYVFHPTKISELKSTIASNSKFLQNPTRIEVVTSLIYRTIIQATKSRSLGLGKTYMLSQLVNLRTRMVPSFPKNSIGNIFWYFPVMIKDDDDTSPETLAAKMREALLKFNNFARNANGKEWLSMAAKLIKDGEHSMDNWYTFSSWCRNFVYEVDFGWGSPMWVSTAVSPYKNNVIIMDSKDGEGIEAWVTLDEEVMYMFEGDEEFLKFASLNPSIQNKLETGGFGVV